MNDLTPTRAEARAYVVALAALWLGAAAVNPAAAPAAPDVVLAAPLASLAVCYGVVARSAARAAGRSVRATFGARRRREPLLVLFPVTLLWPTWWRAVLPATGWPRRAVAAALAALFLAAVVAPLRG